MKVLVIGPPLYGLLYPMLSMAQALRSAGHEVVVASAGGFAGKVATAGLVAFDAAPGLDSEAEYARREDERKRQSVGTRPGNFSFFSHEMCEGLVEFAGDWRPDLIIYPPLGVVARLLGAKFGIPTVLQTVGFAHQHHHVETVTAAMAEDFERWGVPQGPGEDLWWIDVAPPSMSVLDHPRHRTLPMRYVPYNGGSVLEGWWRHPEADQEDLPRRPRVLVSLGTLKPMVDGLELIEWVTHRADDLEAEFVLQLNHNARGDLDGDLPDNVRLIDWIPLGGLVDSADVFIHHGGAGNTFTALAAGVPQIVFGEGADRPTNARIVAERGCGVVPGPEGLHAELIRRMLGEGEHRLHARDVRREIMAMPDPADVVKILEHSVAGV